MQASSYVPAEVIERFTPEYPPETVVTGREGWVILSYVVSTDGAVTEVMIEDSSGNEHFERAAMEGISKWRYRPATLDGEPVEQALTRARSLFVMDGAPASGARAQFVRKYRRADGLLGNGDLEAARALLDELEVGERFNLYEDAWFWFLKYKYLAATHAPSDELIDALEKAIGYHEDYLPADAFLTAVAQLYALYASEFRFAAARGSLKRLRESEIAKSSELYDRTVDVLEATQLEVDALVGGPETFRLSARIGGYDYWVHELSRRIFSLDEIEGEVRKVDVRCERGTTRYHSVAAGTRWTIPDTWGDCGVYIEGRPGTKFAFYEHPHAQ